MAKAKGNGSSQKIRPALTPEAREKQLISLAMDRAEQQLLDGTASSQVITHFLKLGSEREQLEQERLKGENDLLRAKVKALEDSADMKVMYERAIRAMRMYNGANNDDDEEGYDYEDDY